MSTTIQEAKAEFTAALVRGGMPPDDAAAMALRTESLAESVHLVMGRPGATWGALHWGCQLRALALAARNPALVET